MDRVVVDTDIVSFYFKEDSRFELYQADLDGKQLVISFMTLAELFYWQELRHWGERRRALMNDAIEAGFVIYPVHTELCKTWSRLRMQAHESGRVLDSADAWIAATAVQLGLPLASHNQRDFEYLPHLELISRDEE